MTWRCTSASMGRSSAHSTQLRVAGARHSGQLLPDGERMHRTMQWRQKTCRHGEAASFAVGQSTGSQRRFRQIAHVSSSIRSRACVSIEHLGVPGSRDKGQELFLRQRLFHNHQTCPNTASNASNGTVSAEAPRVFMAPDIMCVIVVAALPPPRSRTFAGSKRPHRHHNHRRPARANT